jgi:hypothetical protein
MARALINVPRKARRGEVIEIKTLLSHPMETGIAVTMWAARFRATSSAGLCASTMERKYSRPNCSPQSLPTPSYRFSRSPLKAARWSSGGPTITATLKRRQRASRSNDCGLEHLRLRAWAVLLTFSTVSNRLACLR